MNANYKQVLKDLDEKIEYLQTVRASLVHLYEGEQEEEAQPTRVTKRASSRKRKYASRGSNLQAILDVLKNANAPLSTKDLFVRMQLNGWAPQSKDAYALLGSTLRYAFEHGKVERVGNGWTLKAQALTTEEPLAQTA